MAKINIEEITEYCSKKKGVTQEFPFDEETLVLKVMGKIFLLASLEKIPLQINIKCNPEEAIELREKYEAVIPGYHMNKKHWNTVIVDNTIPPKNILSWIDDSYNLVVNGLKKSEKEELKNLK
jgi:predicted DNA-binding protein (MmcQ/YjbR family)